MGKNLGGGADISQIFPLHLTSACVTGFLPPTDLEKPKFKSQNGLDVQPGSRGSDRSQSPYLESVVQVRDPNTLGVVTPLPSRLEDPLSQGVRSIERT